MQVNFIKDNKDKILSGPLELYPEILKDNRGFFYESWNKKVFNNILNENIDFVQDNHSKSSKGVLRGLHYQLPFMPQSKLVRCTFGSIFDVFVDIREDSETFGNWGCLEINDEKRNLLWLPDGFAHGFLTLSNFAEIQYKTTNFWSKEGEKSIRWNDPSIKIDWPLSKLDLNRPILSSKDEYAETLDERKKKGEIF